MSEKPISELRRRMLEDMAVRKFSEKTRQDYIRHIAAFAKFLGRSPDAATADDRAVSRWIRPRAAHGRPASGRSTRIGSSNQIGRCGAIARAMLIGASIGIMCKL